MIKKQKFDRRDYRTGYHRGNNGSEAIVIASKPEDDNGWKNLTVDYAFYFPEYSASNLPKVLAKIEQSTQEFYNERCRNVGKNEYTEPTMEDVRVTSELHPVFVRDYHELLTGKDEGYSKYSVPLQQSDVAKTDSFLITGKFTVGLSYIPSHIELFQDLDQTNPCSKLVALTLATIVMDTPEPYNPWQEDGESARDYWSRQEMQELRQALGSIF